MSASSKSLSPPIRSSASRICACLCSSWRSYARSCQRQPPQWPKCGQGAVTWSGPNASVSTRTASPCRRLTLTMRARTRSPGSAPVDEHDDAVVARNAAPAEGERVDRELELVTWAEGGSHVRAQGSCGAARGSPSESSVPQPGEQRRGRPERAVARAVRKHAERDRTEGAATEQHGRREPDGLPVRGAGRRARPRSRTARR